MQNLLPSKFKILIFSSLQENLKRQRSSVDDDLYDHPKHSRVEDMDQYSGDEYSD